MAGIAQARVGKPISHATAQRGRPSNFAEPLSAWSRSRLKRFFDVALVIVALPLIAPVCLLIAFAVQVSSAGPVFFRQKRMGREGTTFSVIKFRTMVHSERSGNGSITTIDDDQITNVGRVLRTFKLDELPQFINVLRGEMSLVGPRPRVPEQPIARLDCRPGITGAASLAFAREEALLAGIPRHQLDRYYASRVIPLKQRLDDGYMEHATFASDLRLLVLTVLRVWVWYAPQVYAEADRIIDIALRSK
jgi:lipopolysaccharide/colanic/teichoic acid biosynthesis glycosyltransferase